MPDLSRRTLLAYGATALGGALAGCMPARQARGPVVMVVPEPFPPAPGDPAEPDLAEPIEGGEAFEHHESYARMYGPVEGEPFPVPAAPLKRIPPAFLRREVPFVTAEPPGTLVVDPHAHFLYLVGDDGRAMRYGVGVGKEGFSWSGVATIERKQEWPDWYPPKEMIQRRPDIQEQLEQLRSGQGVPGGTRNPLGARAMYLWQNNKDTLYRIHGTLEPWTIGSNVSSGCIRMINQDVIDLYERVPLGSRVVVMA